MVLRAVQRATGWLLRASRFRHFRHVADGLELHGWTRGDHGPTVVFLHGLGDASTAFRPVVAGLTDARVYLLDLPGFGRSALPDSREFLTVREHAAAVASVLRALPRPRVLVGQSLGGWVTLRVLLDHADAVDGVVLVNPAGVPTFGAERSKILLQPEKPKDVVRLWQRLWWRLPAGARVLAPFTLQRFKQPQYRAFLDAIDAQDAVRVWELRTVTTPGVILWGHHDRLLPRQIATLLHRHGPGLWITYVARAGHLVHLERPDAVARGLGSVLAQLDRNGGAAGHVGPPAAGA